jgi:hypothetical protein
MSPLKPSAFVWLALAAAVLAPQGLAAQKAKPEEGPHRLTVSELIKDRDKWDGKHVEVTAKAEGYEERTSKRGNKYTVLKLVEGEVKVSIWMKGHPAPADAPKNGGKAQAIGIFRKEKKLGQMTFKNEIDVSPVKGKPFALKAVKG